MSITSKIQDQTFLFTGTLTEFTRDEAESLVATHGGKVLSGVSGKLNYLVVGEDAGSKLEKAKAIGTVKILKEKEFLKMVPKADGKSKLKKEATKDTKAVDKNAKTPAQPKAIEISIRAWERNSDGDISYTTIRKISVNDIKKSNWLQDRLEIPLFTDTKEFEMWISGLSELVDSNYTYSSKVLAGPEFKNEEVKSLKYAGNGKTYSLSSSKDTTSLKKLLKGDGKSDPVSFGSKHNGMIIPFAYFFLHHGDMGDLGDYLEFDYPDRFSNDEERVSEEDGLTLWEAVESGWEFVHPEIKKQQDSPKQIISSESGEIQIGNQVWMLRNLDVSHFRNGDPIIEIKSEDDWHKAHNEGTPAWCHFRNKVDNGKKYGKLYNYYAISDPRGLAPDGWHVPTVEEWDALCNQFGTEDEAGDALKSGSDFPKGTGDNRSGFTALPGADRLYYGPWGNDGYANFWTCDEQDSKAKIITLCPSDGYVMKNEYQKGSGLSVRCIKDID